MNKNKVRQELCYVVKLQVVSKTKLVNRRKELVLDEQNSKSFVHFETCLYVYKEKSFSSKFTCNILIIYKVK